jgi:uncharacterized protein (TIGR00369 family)
VTQSERPKLDRDALHEYIQYSPFNRLLGMKGELAKDGRCVLTLEVRQEHVGDPTRPALHGGVVSSLADTAGGFAAWSAVGEGESVSTMDLLVDYLEPGRLAGPLRAEAEVLRKGSRVCHTRMRVTQDGIVVAEARGIYSIHRRSK